MNYPITICGKITWIGANDRRKHLFENMWPLPQGVAYNSYLIGDAKTALVDTVDATVAGNYLERIDSALQGRPLDYVIVNHMEPDHAGMLGALTQKYPNMHIVGNNKTFKLIAAYFGEGAKLLEVKDGDALDLGHHKLQFVMTPWVHWPETMMTYDTTEQVLFSGDAFGSFGTLDGGIFDDEVFAERYEPETLRYYANIVGQYSKMVQKALGKLHGTPVRIICATHGLIWRSRPARIIDLYDRWSRHEAQPGVVIAFASMYGNAEKTADYIARRLAEQGVKDIRLFDVSKTHLSFILAEIWKYRGVILGSCAYNGFAHPMMEMLCNKLEHINPQNKLAGIFGTYSWNGGGGNAIKKTVEALGWPLVSEVAEIQGSPTLAKAEACNRLAQKMAEALQ
jgi:flavorubredoxin